MAMKQVNPNRMELIRLKRQLATAMRGHKLLKDKQDELMRRFLELVQRNYDMRERVEEKINASSQNFALARAAMQPGVLNTALLVPGERISTDVNIKKIMSVPLPEYTFHARSESDVNLYSYGLAFTSSDLDIAVKNVSDILPEMLKLAEIEKNCQLMALEIEKTRRRVNALEHVMIPEIRQQLRSIKMKLDENERSSQIRLMKVKDMILEKAHQYAAQN